MNAYQRIQCPDDRMGKYRRFWLDHVGFGGLASHRKILNHAKTEPIDKMDCPGNDQCRCGDALLPSILLRAHRFQCSIFCILRPDRYYPLFETDG